MPTKRVMHKVDAMIGCLKNELRNVCFLTAITICNSAINKISPAVENKSSGLIYCEKNSSDSLPVVSCARSSIVGVIGVSKSVLQQASTKAMLYVILHNIMC